MSEYYIASCVFTSQFPELSMKIQSYVRERFGYEIVRCCVPRYKIREFEEKMPEGAFRDSWRGLPDSGQFATDKVVCYCHYCLEGLKMGGADAVHLAELLFAEAAYNK